MSEKHIERQYSLIYLFKSYLNMLKKFEGITPDQIVDLTIFTNKDIGALKFLVPVAKDGIFDFEGKGKRYRMDIPMFQIDSRMLTCLRQVRSDDALILGFLKKLVFAVGQPCEPELEELITRDMGRLYRFPDFFYNDLYKSIIEWFLSYDNGKAPYLTKRHVTENLAKTHHMLLQAKNVEEVFTTNALSKLTDEMKSLSLSLSSPSLSPQSSAGFTI
ncbi:hypothetical protein X777_09874 [Ooceraea biroi]|nr:hypothetical protein X777_09874 [Ooceraea biroi]